MNRKHLAILAVVTVVLAVLALMPRKPGHRALEGHQRFFPGLEKRINDVSRVQVQLAGRKPVTVERDGDQWRVKDHYGYPANVGVLRSELLKLARLTQVEPMTSKPARFVKLGLQSVDNAQSGARVIRVWVGKADKPLSLLSGKSGNGGSYVRKEGDNQTWLASDVFAPPTAVVRWLDRRLVHLDRRRIREVVITHRDGKKVALRRENPTAANFQLIGLPDGRKPKSAFALNRVAETLASLSLDDVKPGDAVSFDTPGLTAHLSTFDGLQIEMETVRKGEKTYAHLHASLGERTPGADAKDKKGPADAHLKGKEAVRGEVEALNRRWSGWAYELPAFRVKNLSKTVAELTKTE